MAAAGRAVVLAPAPPSEPDKATQKAILKRIVDPCGPAVNLLVDRCTLQPGHAAPWMAPTMAGALQLLPPQAYPCCPISSVTTRFAAMSPNKTRCAINCVTWTPEGRRAVTGDNIGQLSLWSSSDFKLEQLLQAHDKGLRCAVFSHNGNFLFTADDAGLVRVFKSNMAPLRRLEAHREAVRGLSIAPGDVKFATCSDDASVKVWDLASCAAERTLTGHGSDVRGLDWHPSTSLLATGSRDGTVKLWDARCDPASASLATLHGHKGPVNQVKWNLNGCWLLSTSRDQTLRVWDVRHGKRELVSWQGHAREVHTAAWHPLHLELLASGGADGALMFWLVGQPSAVDKVENAHDGSILSVSFHPLGHMLASTAMEACTKFWVRQRPGDPWGDAQQREGPDAQPSYAGFLATAAATAAGATAPSGLLAGSGGLGGAQPGGGGLFAAAGATQLPGGIQVQLPGLRSAGAGGLPGLAPAAALPPQPPLLGLAGAPPIPPAGVAPPSMVVVPGTGLAPMSGPVRPMVARGVTGAQPPAAGTQPAALAGAAGAKRPREIDAVSGAAHLPFSQGLPSGAHGMMGAGPMSGMPPGLGGAGPQDMQLPPPPPPPPPGMSGRGGGRGYGRGRRGGPNR